MPVVVFCVDEIAQGDEVAIGENVHVTRPDNFNQLRSLLARLLGHGSQSSVSENNATLPNQYRKKNRMWSNARTVCLISPLWGGHKKYSIARYKFDMRRVRLCCGQFL